MHLEALNNKDSKNSAPVAFSKTSSLEPDHKSDLTPKENERDMELVRRFKSGDKTAFNEIMSHYKKKILSFVLPLLKDDHNDAGEVTQDTFIRAHRGLAEFRGDSSLSTWLHTIALNLSRNRYRYWKSRKRDQHVSLDMPLNGDNGFTLANIIPADALPPNDETSTKEFENRIRVAMEKLSPEHREILILRGLKNMKYEEIADILGINVGTVKSRIVRARESLRAKLPEDFPG